MLGKGCHGQRSCPLREQEGAKKTSSTATGIFKAETRGRSSWKEDVRAHGQSPLPPTERIQSVPKWTRKEMPSEEGTSAPGPETGRGVKPGSLGPKAIALPTTSHPHGQGCRKKDKKKKKRWKTSWEGTVSQGEGPLLWTSPLLVALPAAISNRVLDVL